jgi:acetyltransferase-like isoleucine patch superfamily enzyme
MNESLVAAFRSAPGHASKGEWSGLTIFEGVVLGEDVEVQAPCVIGQPPRGRRPGELEVLIGAGSVIRAFTVIYAGAQLGARVQVGHGALIREGNVVGDDSSIGTNTVLEGGCRIGNGVRIHSQCFLESVTVGDEVFIGPGVVFTDDPHPPCPRYVECAQGVTLGRRAKIGGGAVLLPGVTVGEGALVGGGSVVSHDVPPHTVVAGNPARILKRVEELKCFAGLYNRPFEWEEA